MMVFYTKENRQHSLWYSHNVELEIKVVEYHTMADHLRMCVCLDFIVVVWLIFASEHHHDPVQR